VPQLLAPVGRHAPAAAMDQNRHWVRSIPGCWQEQVDGLRLCGPVLEHYGGCGPRQRRKGRKLDGVGGCAAAHFVRGTIARGFMNFLEARPLMQSVHVKSPHRTEHLSHVAKAPGELRSARRLSDLKRDTKNGPGDKGVGIAFPLPISAHGDHAIGIPRV
jgi:hypothetical protein